MLSRHIKRQLLAFALVSAVALSILGVRYLGIPESMGVGRYEVTVSMPEASGLYAGAPVTYQGVQIGTVSATTLTPRGATASLSLKNGHSVPSSARAEIRTGSVIGEPYIGLVPPDGDGKPARAFRDGDMIPGSRVKLPISTATMLTEVRALMDSIPKDALRSTLEEAAAAFGGSSSTLASIIDSGNLLTEAAAKNQQPTLDLIDNAETVLATQDAQNAEIREWATGLDTFSAALARADGDVRTVLKNGGPTADSVTALLKSLTTVLPALAVDTSNLGKVLNVYQPALKHLLIVLPGLLEANGSAQNYYSDQDYGESGLSFKLTVNDPPICEVGFPEAGKMRAPENLTPMPLPANSYCKVAHSDPRVVRGARNMPCPQDPYRRGARAVDCGLVFNLKETLE